MQETTYKGHLIRYHCNGEKWLAVVWGPDPDMAAGGQVVTSRVDDGPEALLRRVRARIDRARIDREMANGAAKTLRGQHHREEPPERASPTAGASTGTAVHPSGLR
jgi:hypothetical protein